MPAEIDKLIAVARRGRYGQRDATLILVAYRHGLRATEVADLEWPWISNPAEKLPARPPVGGQK